MVTPAVQSAHLWPIPASRNNMRFIDLLDSDNSNGGGGYRITQWESISVSFIYDVGASANHGLN